MVHAWPDPRQAEGENMAVHMALVWGGHKGSIWAYNMGYSREYWRFTHGMAPY